MVVKIDASKIEMLDLYAYIVEVKRNNKPNGKPFDKTQYSCTQNVCEDIRKIRHSRYCVGV